MTITHSTTAVEWVLRFDTYSEAWVDFIITNRSSRSIDYDIVIGPIANDNVRSQFAMYENKEITKAGLLEGLKFKRPTFQYCFISKLAISLLTPLQS